MDKNKVQEIADSLAVTKYKEDLHNLDNEKKSEIWKQAEEEYWDNLK